MFGKKVVKRCPKGHEMELAWRRCPRCTGRTGGALEARDITELTVVVEGEEPSSDETRVVAPGSPEVRSAVTPVARLAGSAGPLAGQELKLFGGRSKLGKAPSEESGTVVLVVADPYLSKDHAAFEAGAGGVVIRDLGSTNGTFVNGQRVERAVLTDGDELRLGASVLRVVIGR